VIHVTNSGAPSFDPHGPDPTSGGFGAHVFTSDPGTPGMGGTYSEAAHSEYWEKNNDALKNMGRVIAGLPTY
jgi:hypothetical protein